MNECVQMCNVALIVPIKFTFASDFMPNTQGNLLEHRNSEYLAA